MQDVNFRFWYDEYSVFMLLGSDFQTNLKWQGIRSEEHTKRRRESYVCADTNILI